MNASHNIIWANRIRRQAAAQDGVALIVALLMMMLFAALGMAIVMTTTAETQLTGNFQSTDEGLYAADAALEKVMDDALSVTNWNDIIQGIQRSGFVDGPITIGNRASLLDVPIGAVVRTLTDGRTIDIGELANIARCGHPNACSQQELNALTVDRPWGVNNPLWVPFAYGPVNELLAYGSDDPDNPINQVINSPYYIVVFAGDDPSEQDNDPTVDGTSGGLGSTISLRAEAFGPRGSHRIIEATVSRTDTSALERGYIAQRGEDEQNRRYRKMGVGTPGAALTRMELSLSAGCYDHNAMCQ